MNEAEKQSQSKFSALIVINYSTIILNNLQISLNTIKTRYEPMWVSFDRAQRSWLRLTI